MVGLSNIDNTSDANKPVSSATQTALNLKANLAGDLAGTNSSASNPIISNAAINTNKLADDAVTSGKISNGTIATIDLQDNLITTSKIANGAVVTDDIANSAVTDVKIAGISGNKVSGNIPGNSANVTGTVAIGNGGTGATTQQAAINALTGSQSSGKFLRSNGTNALLATIQASDVPTLNQNTSGSAASLATARNIYGNTFDGTSSLNQIITSTYGGTGNGYTKFSGPSSSEKTFTLPNSNATLLSSAATVTVAQGGTGANTLASNQVLLGNGTGAIQTVAPGSAGNVLMSNGSTWVSASNSAPDNTHSIGDSYGGGIIFYVYDGGAHGLIAATSDQSSSIDWDLGSSFETRAKANGVGAGLKNTSILIASLLSQRNNWNYDNYNSQNFAAALCNEYTKSETINNIETTYGDWYLPSKYELNLLYIKRSVVGNFSSAKYWSSTEYDGTKAWTINFGTQSGSAESSQDKNSSFRVRAIRAF
jgi:hypothetical protein